MDITNLYFALHVIGFVSWIAGLLYLGRILVYHSEAYNREAKERDILTKQFLLMEKRVNVYIAFPAMILTWVMGLLLMSATKAYFFAWFQIKFFLITLMVVLHLYYGVIVVKFKRNQSDKPPMTTFFLKAYNESVTLIFIFIVFAASIKVPQQIFMLWGITFFLFVALFFLARLKSSKRAKR